MYRRLVYGTHITVFISVLVMALSSCNDAVDAKAFKAFIKDEQNGYTKIVARPSGANWTIMYAPAELMALNEIKKNVPGKKEFKTTVEHYSELSYYILEIKDEPQLLGGPCEQIFLSGCGEEKNDAALCQEIYSLGGGRREFLVAYSKTEVCPENLCIYFKPDGSELPEKIACFDQRQASPLPQIKTN